MDRSEFLKKFIFHKTIPRLILVLFLYIFLFVELTGNSAIQYAVIRAAKKLVQYLENVSTSMGSFGCHIRIDL